MYMGHSYKHENSKDIEATLVGYIRHFGQRGKRDYNSEMRMGIL